MKTIRFLLFVISYGMVLNQAYSYQLETIADETYSKYHNSINQILPDMKVTQNMIFKGDPRIQFSNKHSKVKRSLLKRPLRPTPNAADSSACRSCYSRRKGCLLVSTATFYQNSYLWCMKSFKSEMINQIKNLTFDISDNCCIGCLL